MSSKEGTSTAFRGHLMTTIKVIALFLANKAVTTLAFFHVPGLVNARCITVGSFPVCVTREVNKNPL